MHCCGNTNILLEFDSRLVLDLLLQFHLCLLRLSFNNIPCVTTSSQTNTFVDTVVYLFRMILCALFLVLLKCKCKAMVFFILFTLLHRVDSLMSFLINVQSYRIIIVDFHIPQIVNRN